MKVVRYWLCLRGFVASMVVLLILVSIAYICFCRPAANVHAAGDGDNVVLVGQVKRAYGDPSGDAVFVIEDPTGAVFVLSRLGLPGIDTVVVVWGSKTTTDGGRPLVIERRRAGTF